MTIHSRRTLAKDPLPVKGQCRPKGGSVGRLSRSLALPGQNLGAPLRPLRLRFPASRTITAEDAEERRARPSRTKRRITGFGRARLLLSQKDARGEARARGSGKGGSGLFGGVAVSQAAGETGPHLA